MSTNNHFLKSHLSLDFNQNLYEVRSFLLELFKKVCVAGRVRASRFFYT